MVISLRTLKRRLLHLGLNIKRNTSTSVTQAIIERELAGPRSQLGYRGMWSFLSSSYNIKVPRDEVMRLLKELDPVGTEERRARKLKRREYTSKGNLLTSFIEKMVFALLKSKYLKNL